MGEIGDSSLISFLWYKYSIGILLYSRLKFVAREKIVIICVMTKPSDSNVLADSFTLDPVDVTSSIRITLSFFL